MSESASTPEVPAAPIYGVVQTPAPAGYGVVQPRPRPQAPAASPEGADVLDSPIFGTVRPASQAAPPQQAAPPGSAGSPERMGPPDAPATPSASADTPAEATYGIVPASLSAAVAPTQETVRSPQ